MSLECEACDVRVGVSVHDLPEGISLGEVLQELVAMHADCETIIDLTGEPSDAEVTTAAPRGRRSPAASRSATPPTT
jgi:hypothetical protein